MSVCVCVSVTGEAFDIREFHEEILRLGPVPIHVLELSLYQWIQTQVGQAPDTVALSNSLTLAALLFCWISVWVVS